MPIKGRNSQSPMKIKQSVDAIRNAAAAGHGQCTILQQVRKSVGALFGAKIDKLHTGGQKSSWKSTMMSAALLRAIVAI